MIKIVEAKFTPNKERGVVIVSSSLEPGIACREELQGTDCTNLVLAYARKEGMANPVLEEPPTPIPINSQGRVIKNLEEKCVGYRAEVKLSSRL